MGVTKRTASIVTFTVEGEGLFPFDMLRYDACYPATEQDSYSAALLDSSAYDGKRKVRLRHRILKDECLDGYPRMQRWSSFSWRVIPGSIDYDK